MKIYTKVVFNWNPTTEQYEETYAETYDYNGDVALCQYRETEVPVYTSAYDRFLDYLARVVPEMTDQVRRSREFEDQMQLKEREMTQTQVESNRNYKLQKAELDFGMDTEMLRDISLMPKRHQADAYQALAGDMTSVEGENRRAARYGAAQKVATEHDDLMLGLKPIPFAVVRPPGADPNPMGEFNEQNSHFNLYEAKALAFGNEGLAKAIKHAGDSYRTEAANDMMMTSAENMIDFFQSKGALSANMAEMYKGIIDQGGASVITPQLTALMDSELVTRDEAQKFVTDMVNTNAAIMQSYVDAELDPPGWLRDNLSMWLQGLEEPATEALDLIAPEVAAQKEIKDAAFKTVSQKMQAENIPGTPTSDMVSAFLQVNKPVGKPGDADFKWEPVLPSAVGWSPEKTIDASSKFSLGMAFGSLPLSVRKELREVGSHPHREGTGTKIPTEEALKKHLKYVIVQGGRGGQFHRAMIKYLKNLQDVEVEDLQRHVDVMSPAEAQARAKEIDNRYERLRTYRP